MTQQAPSSPPPAHDAGGPQPTIGELISRISENVSGLVKGEIDLAKAKGRRMARSMGLGAGLLGVAAVLALYALGLLFDSIAQGIGEALPVWAGYLIVSVVLFVIVAILALIGVTKLKEGKKDTPAPQVGLKEDVETVKSALASGMDKGKQQ